MLSLNLHGSNLFLFKFSKNIFNYIYLLFKEKKIIYSQDIKKIISNLSRDHVKYLKQKNSIKYKI